MIALTEPLQSALDRNNGTPLHIVDPRTNQSYVLLRADVFEKLKAVFDDDFDIRSAYPLIDAQMRAAGWDDPEWDSYDVYARGIRP